MKLRGRVKTYYGITTTSFLLKNSTTRSNNYHSSSYYSTTIFKKNANVISTYSNDIINRNSLDATNLNNNPSIYRTPSPYDSHNHNLSIFNPWTEQNIQFNDSPFIKEIDQQKEQDQDLINEDPMNSGTTNEVSINYVLESTRRKRIKKMRHHKYVKRQKKLKFVLRKMGKSKIKQPAGDKRKGSIEDIE